MKERRLIEIKEQSIHSSEALNLIKELSDSLQSITGNSGQGSFELTDMENARAVFLMVYEDKRAVGCGALREIDLETAEMKRVYAKEKGKGVGSAIVRALEEKARGLDYKKVILETRKVNQYAVNFYIHKGYQVTENYGKYIGRDEAICFEKWLVK